MIFQFSKFRQNVFRLICVTGTTALTIKHLTTDILAKSPVLNEQLVSVHLFSRHGARTPLFIVPDIEQVEYHPDLLEPYVKAKYALKTLENKKFKDYMSHYDNLNFNNKLKGGAGRGQLTVVGEKQMFNLGRRVRDKYMKEIEFLNPDYNPSEIYSRSSHFRRTINSAKCFLAGVFNEKHTDNRTDSPFIINILDQNKDYIFPNGMDCPYYSEMYMNINKLHLFSKDKEFGKHLSQLHNKVYKGKKDQSFINFTKFRDDMIARDIHDKEVPENFKEDFEKSHVLASKELSAMSTNNLKICCGRLLHMIKNNLNDQISKDGQNEKDFHKLRYYSVHDTTLNALMNAFHLMDEENEVWPPFAADIVIELWKENDKNEYFVRLFYCDKPMKLSNKGDYKFKLDDFMNALKKYETTQDNYTNMCSQSFTG